MISDLIAKVRSLAFSTYMDTPLTKLSLNDAAEMYKIFDVLEKKIVKRKKELNAFIKTQVISSGSKTESGHYSLFLGEVECIGELKTSKYPDDEKVLDLLKSKDIDTSEVFEETSMLQYNPAKMEFLIRKGVLDREVVEALHETTYALKVKASPALDSALGDDDEEEAPRETVSKRASLASKVTKKR